MTGLNDYTKDEYRTAWAQQSQRLRKTLNAKTAIALDTYLMSFGEAKNYNEHRHLVNTLIDAILVYLVTDGWLAITPKGMASPDEQAAFLNASSPGGDLLDLGDS